MHDDLPAIEAVHLTKVYKGAPAVDDLTVRVSRGSITALLGGNGAGKTTTIGMILGLIKPTSGQILVHGIDMDLNPQQARSKINFESPYMEMPHRLTVRENLRVFGLLYGVARIGEKIEHLAESFALTSFLDRKAGQLSAGQKTRVALAKALINSPDLLLLDEPTASLDPDTADWVRTSLQAYRKDKGATILLASHNMAEVERLCDRVIILQRGKIAADDTPRNMIESRGRTNLEDVFLDIVRGRSSDEQVI